MNALSQTLRFRVAIWYAVVLSIVLALFGGLIYGIVRLQLFRHHDRALQETAAAVARVLDRGGSGQRLTEREQTELDESHMFIAIRESSREKRVLYRSPNTVALMTPIEREHPSRAVERTWFETIPGRAGPVRVFSSPYRSEAGRDWTLHVADSLGDVPAPLASLRFALLLMAPVAVLISAAAGYWLAGRALAPVDEVTRMAREIEASRLSQRLPLPKARDEIGRLVETFNQMIARLEASFEAMKRFTADASHELRGPLATMRGAIDVTLSRPREEAEYREVLVSVGEDVDRLRSITEDLLVLARADAGRITLERNLVRLDVVATEVAESFASTAEEKQVRITADCLRPVVVLGDERWLRQLAVNLVDNAVKFSSGDKTPAGSGSITVVVNPKDGLAELKVSDSGPGIPPEALDRIFERFYRADDARSYGGGEGFGLGLAIAVWIVEAHGGTIAASNRPEGGCLFTVSFPLAKPE